MAGVKGQKGGGGFRVGAGRKPSPLQDLRVRGGKSRRKAAPVVVSGVAVPMPADLPPDQAAVWTSEAPLAHRNGTLTAATASAFRDMCRATAIRDGLFSKIQEDGWTYISVRVDGTGTEHQELKKHPLTVELRGWEQRVETKQARFLLNATGKPALPSEQLVDEFAEFEAVPLRAVK